MPKPIISQREKQAAESVCKVKNAMYQILLVKPNWTSCCANSAQKDMWI